MHRHCFSTIPDGALGTEALLTPVKLEEADVTQRTFPQPASSLPPPASRSSFPTVPSVGPQIRSAGLPPLGPTRGEGRAMQGTPGLPGGGPEDPQGSSCLGLKAILGLP